jgi:hypothetical protein
VKRDAEALRVRDQAAKAKVKRDFETKITDLQKNHVVETQKMTVRHQDDEAQVRRVMKTSPDKAHSPDKKK